MRRWDITANNKMKKILGVWVMIVITASVSYTYGNELKLNSAVNFDNHNSYTTSVLEDSKLLAYNSTVTYEVLVYASDVVDDLCNYFQGSWLDYGLKIYCRFGGDVVVCTTYKIVSVACGLNGVVRLMMEGDYNNAFKRILSTSSDIFSLIKENGNFVLQSPINNTSY